MTGAEQMIAMREAFEALNREARELFESHGKEKLEKRPDGNGWSAADCMAHVAQTVRKYLPGIDAAIAEGLRDSVRSPGPFRYGWMSRLFVWIVGPPARMKVKAPQEFVPERTLSAEEALEDFVWHHEALIGRLDLAAGLDLEKLKTVSPVNEKMKFELGAVFLIMEAHGRRHMEQARRTAGVLPG